MNNIKKLRTKNGLSLREMAEDFSSFLKKHGEGKGVSNVTISRWENEKNSPTAEMWGLLAEYFKVSVDYLKGAWSEDEVLKLIQDSYLNKDSQEIIETLKEKRKVLESSYGINENGLHTKVLKDEEITHTLSSFILPCGGDPMNAQTAVATYDYFESWLLFLNSNYSEESLIDSLIFLGYGYDKAAETDVDNKVVPELKANLEIVINGKNKASLLNDSYIWYKFFSELTNDELISVLMESKAPKKAMLIAIKYALNDRVYYLRQQIDSGEK